MLEPWRTSIAVLLVAVAAGTGCGGDDDDGTSEPADESAAAEPADKRIAADAFAAEFKKATGGKLIAQKGSSWVTLSSPTDSDHYGEYGTYTIYVLTSVDQGLDTLLTDEGGKKLEADSEGIYWAQADSGSWSAIKRFGNNVVLHWQASDEKRTDDRWDRLVPAIEQAVGG